MKLFCLQLFLVSIALSTYITDGDFQSFQPNAYNSYSGSWYNEQSILYKFHTFFYMSNCLALSPTGETICQDVTTEARGTFAFNFKHLQYNTTTDPFGFSLIASINGQNNTFECSIFSAKGYFEIYLQPDTHSICFQNSMLATDHLLLVDNVTMSLTKYYDQVSYSVSESVLSPNTIFIEMQFQDFYGENYWRASNFIQFISISIDNVQINNPKTEEIASTLTISAQIQSPLTSDAEVLLSIADGEIFLQTQQPVYFEEEKNGNIPYVPYQDQNQIALVQSFNTVTKTVVKGISLSYSGWGLVGASYFISNLLAFCNILALYNYLNFKWVLAPYRVVFNKILQIFLEEGDLNMTILNLIVQGEISYKSDKKIEEKIPSSQTGLKGMRQHGFSSSFLENSWDQLISIALMIVKLMIVRLLCLFPTKIIRRSAKNVKKDEKILFIYEVIAITPTIILPIGFVLSVNCEMGFGNFSQKMNGFVVFFIPFILFVCPFILLMQELRKQRTKEKKPKKKEKKKEDKKEDKIKENQTIMQKMETVQNQNQKSRNQMSHIQMIRPQPIQKVKKQKKKKKQIKQTINKTQKPKKFNEQQKKCIISFVQNILLFIIPFLVGLSNVDLFVFVTLSLMIFRIVILLKNRGLFSKWQLFKQVFNRFAWLIFNLVYFIYWVIEKAYPKQIPVELFTFLKALGITSILIIFIGCIGESLFLIIDLGIWIYEQCKSTSTEKKIQIKEELNGQKQIDKQCEQKVEKKNFTQVQNENSRKKENTFKCEIVDLEPRVQRKKKTYIEENIFNLEIEYEQDMKRDKQHEKIISQL